MWWKWILWGVGVVIVGGGAAFGLWAYSIFYMVKHSPKRQLHLCNKHGLILPDHCITFLGQPYCPYCFAERRRGAEESALVTNQRVNLDSAEWKLMPK